MLAAAWRWSRWHSASGLALVAHTHATRCARSSRGATGCARRGRAGGVRTPAHRRRDRGRVSSSDRRRASPRRRGTLGWSLGTACARVTVACDVTTPFLEGRAARVHGPQKGATSHAGRFAARAPAGQRLRPRQIGHAHKCADVRALLEGGGAAGGLAGGLARSGPAEPGFDVAAQAAGLDALLDGRRPCRHRRGSARRHELRGQGRRRRARVGSRSGCAHPAVIVGQVTEEARDEGRHAVRSSSC